MAPALYDSLMNEPTTKSQDYAIEIFNNQVEKARDFNPMEFTSKLLFEDRAGVVNATSQVLYSLAWRTDEIIHEMVSVETWRLAGRLANKSNITAAVAEVLGHLKSIVDRGPEDSSTGRCHNLVGRETWEAHKKVLRDFEDLEKLLSR